MVLARIGEAEAMVMVDEMAMFLQQNNLGTVETDIFTSFMPDSPDFVTVLTQYAGEGPVLSINPVNLREVSGLQIRTRSRLPDPDSTTNTGEFYNEAKNQLEKIITLLHGLGNQDIGSSHYVIITARQSPIDLGHDKLLRWEFSVNFSVQRTRDFQEVA
jgi:hypothetical protein